MLGQVLSFALALYYLLRRFQTASLSAGNLMLRFPIVGTILSLGSAMFTTHILAITAQIIQVNSLKHYGALSVYGSEAVIAAGAVGKLSIVFLSSIIGISVGSQPILGFNLGNKNMIV